MAVHDLDRIEQRIDRVTAGAITVSDSVGGVAFANMSEMLEFAKLLSLAGTAVPKHLRGNPGACLAITIQALEWRMSVVAVANKSYEVNDRIAYESQLIHAVVEARAPLKQRLRSRYDGEGDDLTCTVTGHIKGEVDPLEYTSPAVGKITTKNSPLWRSDVRQQLWYYSVRAWARRYCPDVLLGIYAEDELDRDDPATRAKDITPGISQRLAKNKGKRGFSPDNVAALEHRPGETLPEPKPGKEAGPVAVGTAPDAAGKTEPPPATTAPLNTEPEMMLAADLVAGVQNKTRALANCKTEEDVRGLVDGVTELLRGHNRNDLLTEFLDAAKRATDRLTK